MSSCQLIFPEIRNSLMFSSFGVKPPASGFQSYTYSSLKTGEHSSNAPASTALAALDFSANAPQCV